MPVPQTLREQHEISSRVWNECQWHDGRTAVLVPDGVDGPIVGPGAPADEDRAAGRTFRDMARPYTWDEIDAILTGDKVFGRPA